MNEESTIPHMLTLNYRQELQMSGVSEVVSFDEQAVIVKTGMGLLTIHGQNLQLRNLSLEGGQIAVEGMLTAFVYEEPQKGGILRRLFG